MICAPTYDRIMVQRSAEAGEDRGATFQYAFDDPNRIPTAMTGTPGQKGSQRQGRSVCSIDGLDDLLAQLKPNVGRHSASNHPVQLPSTRQAGDGTDEQVLKVGSPYALRIEPQLKPVDPGIETTKSGQISLG